MNKKIIITESQLRDLIRREKGCSLLSEAQTKIDNFDLIAQKIMEEGPDNVYPVQIIRRWKDNPTDFAGKAAGKRNGTYSGGAWHLKHWLIRGVQDLYDHKAEIIRWCEDNNARAYIMLNPRSYNDTTNYINAQKHKYGRNYRPTEEIKAWFASKSGPNWKDQRPKLFLDIDSPNQDLWDAVHNLISKYGINVVTEYTTPSGGLHIVLADKNQQGLEEFRKKLVIFDSGKDLKRNATVHPNEDGKLILYSNVKTPGYLEESYDPMDSYPYYGAESKAVIVLSNDGEFVDILTNIPQNDDPEQFIYVIIHTTDFNHTHYEKDDGDYYTPPSDEFDAGEWDGEWDIEEIWSDNESANEDNPQFMELLQKAITENYDEIETALIENAELIEY